MRNETESAREREREREKYLCACVCAFWGDTGGEGGWLVGVLSLIEACGSDHTLNRAAAAQVKSLMDKGFTPVLHGDAVLDLDQVRRRRRRRRRGWGYS